MTPSLQDLERVLEITRQLSTATDLDQILPIIIEQAARILDTEWATVFLYDPGTEEFFVRASLDGLETRFPADRGIAGAAAAQEEALMVQDAYADPRFFRGVDQETGQRTRNMIACRLPDYDGHLAGVLEVLNKRDGGFTASDKRLVEIFSAQAGVALQRARLVQDALGRVRLEEQLEVARTMQRELLPDGLPGIPGYGIQDLYEPADHVGGDLYDVFPLPEGRWGILLGDATGHGVGAALIGTEARALIRGILAAGQGIRSAIQAANEFLAEDLPANRFVTLIFGILSPDEHVLHYVSAGQAPLLILRAAGGAVEQRDASGIPLGMMGAFPYPEPERLDLAPGDMLAVLTDGFFECRSAEDEEFGTRRVREWLLRHAGGDLSEILTGLKDEALAFEHEEQRDDLTGLLLRREEG